jgi:hypothetical protein
MTSRVFVVRRSPLARPLTAVIAAVLAASALAGCTGVSFAGECDPVFEPGDASNAVTASGDVGDSPAVEFPTPLIADETQRSVLVEGAGEPAAAGSLIRARYTYFDGATGASGTESTDFFTASDLAMGLGESLECVTVGSRIAVVGPVAEVLAGVEEGTEGTIVAILDIEAIYLGKANGVNQLPQDGMPTVVTAVNGEPGISSTYQPIAEEPRTATIKAGSGATVAEGDTVVFHARSWNWSAGTTSTVTLGDVDSWTTGTPFALAPSVESLGDETLVDAFLGATVGSQVLVVVPAADTASSATVYVFDFLGILATE